MLGLPYYAIMRELAQSLRAKNPEELTELDKDFLSKWEKLERKGE